MRAFFSVLLVLLALAVVVPCAHAGELVPSRYSTVNPSADGIGKMYLGREIAKVMTYHGADWLERAERAREERPDMVIGALALKPGIAVADIGAGTGYYAWRIAQRIGRSGTVYAVDIQPEMVRLLERQIARRGVSNVKPILGTATDPGLPPDTLDLAFMVDVYHEFEFPHEMLQAIVRALKPGGRLVFVEFRGDDATVPIKRLHTMTETQVRKETDSFALEWMKTVRDLPWQHVIVFRKVAAQSR